MENDLEQNLKLNLEKAKVESKLEIAKAMLSKGFDEHTIFETTGCTKQEIKKYFP